MITLKSLILENNSEVNSKKMARLIRLAISSVLDIDKEFSVVKFASNFGDTELKSARYWGPTKRKPEVSNETFSEFSMGFLFYYKIRSYFAHVYFTYYKFPSHENPTWYTHSDNSSPKFPTIDMVRLRHPQLHYHADVSEYEPSNVEFEKVVRKFLGKRLTIHNGWEWKGNTAEFEYSNNILDLVNKIKRVCDDNGPDGGGEDDSPQVPDPSPSTKTPELSYGNVKE